MWALLSYPGIGVLEPVEGVRQYVPAPFLFQRVNRKDYCLIKSTENEKSFNHSNYECVSFFRMH